MWHRLLGRPIHRGTAPVQRRARCAPGSDVAKRYSGHSLRRGFATWATRYQWSLKALMEYFGWRDVHSAMRYVEADTPFGDWRRHIDELKLLRRDDFLLRYGLRYYRCIT